MSRDLHRRLARLERASRAALQRLVALSELARLAKEPGEIVRHDLLPADRARLTREWFERGNLAALAALACDFGEAA